MFRRIIHLFTAFFLIAATWQPIAIHAEELNAEQKYQNLVEAGIFNGFPTGESLLDQNTTRAQAAKIVTLILGLEENAAGANIYKDLAEAEWAVGYIGAATEAGILEGYGNGIFDPTADVTKEQLCKIMVETLDIEIDPDATVEGASEWAGKYVAAAVNAGLIPEQSDYTVPASRELLVEASYFAYEQIKEQIGIKSAKQTGVRLVQIGLMGKIDPGTASITIERIGDNDERTLVSIESLEWSSDGNIVTAVLSEVAEAGSYEVKLVVVQSGETSSFSQRYEVEPETLTRIELGGGDLLPRANDVEVPFYLYNQYDEPMSTRPSTITVADTFNTAELHPDRNAVLVDLADQQNSEQVSITLFVDEKLNVTRTYNLGAKPFIQSIKSDGFVDQSGTTVDSLNKGDSAYLLLRPYDQYGNLITDIRWLNENLKIEESVKGTRTQKELVSGPDDMVAVRVKAGSYQQDTLITVIVRSLSGSELVKSSITVNRDLALKDSEPKRTATITVDPNSIVTVTGATYLDVTSTNVTELYYALLYDFDMDVPTAEDLLKVETNPPSGAYDYGKVNTNGKVRLELNTSSSLTNNYKLYLVGSNSSKSLVSNMLVMDIDTTNEFKLEELLDMSDLDPDNFLICLVHTPWDAKGTVYYLVTDNPLIDYEMDDVDKAEEVVQYVEGIKSSGQIVFYGKKHWNGMSDQIIVGNKGDKLGTYHAYVVLEYRGIRQFVEGTIYYDGN